MKTVEKIKIGDFVKRKPNAKKTFTRGEYCKENKKYTLNDYSDISNCIYVKKGTLLVTSEDFQDEE